MLLGRECTRACGFCNVRGGAPGAPDRGEPRRVAEAVRAMGLRGVVLTSVTRDDLPDGGAGLWAETIRAVRGAVPGIVVEVLVPDFGGDGMALDRVLAERPDVFGHNLETVRSLYAAVRPQADYGRSLAVLRQAGAQGLIVKTGIMLGLGETREEVRQLMRDALAAGCQILYIGQYLRPGRRHAPVVRYVEPVEFDDFREAGLRAGFRVVVAAPLVRSSYHAEDQERFVAGRKHAAV
jgi:lipoic acid synthetase